jgi:WD40 repeat protein
MNSTALIKVLPPVGGGPIQARSALVQVSVSVARVFISHASANNLQALALRDWLSSEGIDDVFLDVDPERGLVSGERWQDALKTAADRCEAILFLISSAWLQSRWCLAEFLLAKTLHKRIFGLLIEAVGLERIPLEMTAEWQLCDLVTGHEQRAFALTHEGQAHHVSFSEPALHLLRRGLHRAGLAARSFPWPPAAEPKRAPYRGLRALDAEDAAIYFGRDAMIVRGLDRIRGLVENGVDNCLVILGASGSGKSSFLRAGLLPRLARSDTLFLPLPIVRPESAVLTGASGLARSLALAFERFGAPRSKGAIKAAIAEGLPTFRALLQELVQRAQARLVHIESGMSAPTIVLPIDQAEELFVSEGAAESAAFQTLLSDFFRSAGGLSQPSLIVLATVRSDHYVKLQSDDFIPGMTRQLLDLTPIPPAEFKSIITGPALRSTEAGQPLTFDPDLIEDLIADAGGADSLPLLSFTLERLYSDFGSEGRLTLAAYRALGGVRGSIEAAIAQAFARPHDAPTIPTTREEQLALARAAFIPWLARIAPESGVPARRVARLDEIPQACRPIVERLIGARLLVVDHRDKADVVEVAHESLLRQWPALTAWLEADAEDLRTIENIERAAEEWAENDRADVWLDHRGDRLAAALRLTERADFSGRFGRQGSDYLAACLQREQREQADREAALAREAARLQEVAAAQARTATMQRRGRQALVIATLAVLIGGVLAVWQHLQNLQLDQNLAAQRMTLQQAQEKLFGELSVVERQRNNLDAALRFAIYAVRRGGGDRFTAAQLATVEAHVAWRLSVGSSEGSIGDANFNPDGTQIVMAAGAVAILWDARTGAQIRAFHGHDKPIWTTVFNRDGTRLLTASEDATARLWDVGTGRLLQTFHGHSDKVTSASFSPDERMIVTSSFDRTIRLWSATTGLEIATLRGHLNTVQSAIFSPDGTLILSASDDTTARLWSVATRTELRVLRGHKSAVYAAAFSPDGRRIVTGSNDNTGRLWDVATGRELVVLRGHKGYVNCVSFSPDGTKVLTSSADQTIRLWDSVTGAPLKLLHGHEGYVNTAHFNASGSEIVSGSHDETTRIWPIADRGVSKVFASDDGGLTSIAISPDETLLAAASNGKTIKIWDHASGKLLHVLTGHDAPVLAVAFLPDGKRLLSASQDRTARLWDVSSGRQIASLSGSTNWVMAAAVSHDGTRIATASWDRQARLYDTATGALERSFAGHEAVVSAIAFSPDGRWLATGSWDKTARIWDVATGQLIKVFPHSASVESVAFSADGTQLLTASDDRTAIIWDISSARTILILQGHEGPVRSAQFSSDMQRIVTASDDMTARIWAAKTGDQLDILHDHSDSVTSAVFDRSGSHVFTASADGTARESRVNSTPASLADRVARICHDLLGTKSAMTQDDLQFLPDRPPALDVCDGSPVRRAAR